MRARGARATSDARCGAVASARAVVAPDPPASRRATPAAAGTTDVRARGSGPSGSPALELADHVRTSDQRTDRRRPIAGHHLDDVDDLAGCARRCGRRGRSHRSTATAALGSRRVASWAPPASRASRAAGGRRSARWRGTSPMSRRDRCSWPAPAPSPRCPGPRRRRAGRAADRSAVRTSSSRGIGRMPSGVAGRASSRTTWALVGCSSAVSSRTMMRSPGSVRLSRDAEQRGLAARRGAADHDVAPGSQHVGEQLDDAADVKAASGRARRRKRRIDTAAPSTATGPITAHTRDPSGEPGVDDRVGAVEAAAQRRQHPFEHDGDRRGRQRLRGVELAGALDPHLAAGVDEDLVDVAVGHQRVEPVEPGEAGDGSGDEPRLLRFVGERRDGAHVAAHDGVDVARDLGDAAAQRVDQLVLGHAAFRSSRWIRRGRRAARSPASTARATAGSRAMRRHDRRVDRRFDVAGAKRPAGLFDEHDAGRPRLERHGAPQREVAGAGDEQRAIGGVAGGRSAAARCRHRRRPCRRVPLRADTERLPALGVGGCPCEPAHTTRTRPAPPASRGRSAGSAWRPTPPSRGLRAATVRRVRTPMEDRRRGRPAGPVARPTVPSRRPPRWCHCRPWRPNTASA